MDVLTEVFIMGNC